MALEPLLDVAALLTSELVTNVVRHVGAPMTLRRLMLALRIEVDDRSPESPAVRQVRPPSEHGRGVFLVDAMASDWGSERTAVGKTVWFELEIPSAAAEWRGRPWRTGQPSIQSPRPVSSKVLRTKVLGRRSTSSPSSAARRCCCATSTAMPLESRYVTSSRCTTTAAGDPLECRPELGARRQVDLTGGVDGGEPLHPMNVDVQVFFHRDLRGCLGVRVRCVVSIRRARLPGVPTRTPRALVAKIFRRRFRRAHWARTRWAGSSSVWNCGASTSTRCTSSGRSPTGVPGSHRGRATGLRCPPIDQGWTIDIDAVGDAVTADDDYDDRLDEFERALERTAARSPGATSTTATAPGSRSTPRA